MRKALLTHVVTLLAFLLNTFGSLPMAQANEFILPKPGVMIHLSPEFNPPVLKGIKVHTENPFLFDFILDKGDGELSNDQLKSESSKLIKYFLASLTIPEKDLWVNLSPYEKDRIIPQSFGLTEMGRDLLAEDYMLKQITASLIYPEDEVGKKFWKRIYDESAKRYGTTNVPINTFNKVWIMPDKAVIYENVPTGTAYVAQSNLKVMLEQDYLSLEKHVDVQSGKVKNTSALGNQIVREIVIPELTKEINENKNFARLRQVYNSLILATWYKRKIRDSILAQVYSDRNKVAGVNIDDPKEKEKIYQHYLMAFKKGVYNYIKEEQDPMTQEVVPRKYFSGGMNLDFSMTTSLKIQSVSDGAMLSALGKKALQIIKALVKGLSPGQNNIEENLEMPEDNAPAIFQKPQLPVVSFEQLSLPDNITYFNLILFLQAQKRLKSLSREELQTLLSSLDLLKSGETIGENLDEYYSRVYQYLAQNGYSEDVIYKIKGNAEPDVGLDRTVLFQSGSSKTQSILEAVANSIDALGGSIGQFGMGVKQILAWLEDDERVEVFSRKQGQKPYRLVITRRGGNFEVAIVNATEKDFYTAMGGISSATGTVINVIKNKDIPVEGEGITLKSLEQNIHQRFAYVKWLNIWTRVGTNSLRYVNGWEHRSVLAGLENLTHENITQAVNRQVAPTVVVSLEPKTLRMIDTGSGMDFQVLSRMFLPVEGGDKENKVMTTPEEVDAEANKISLVHEHQGEGSSVVFARNGEAIMKVAIHSTMTDSLLQGQLMVDLGRLMRVSPARDKIVLQRNQDEEPLKKGFIRLVRHILQSDYSDKEKVKIINTLIGGLEGIAPGNKSVSDIIDTVKMTIKREMKTFIVKLRHEGSIILPLRNGFNNFETPNGKPVIFLNESLFDWRGSEIKQLKENMGASVLPIVLEAKARDSDLPIRTMVMAVPFRSEVWQEYHVGNFQDILQTIKSRAFPVVRGDGYLIVPSQIGDVIAGLSEDSEKTKEMLELIKIIAEEDTANGYEFTVRPSRAFAAFGVKGQSTTETGTKRQWTAEENFLEWGNEESTNVAPTPYGSQEAVKKKPFNKDFFSFIHEKTPYFHINKDFEFKNIEFDKIKFTNIFIGEPQPARDIGDYLNSLAKQRTSFPSVEPVTPKTPNVTFNPSLEDLAMIALPKNLAFEEDKENYTLDDFERVCTTIVRNNNRILFKYSGEKQFYILLSVNGREIEKFWSLAIPFNAERGVINNGSVVLQEEDGLREIHIGLDEPDKNFRIKLNVSPEKSNEWRQKLSTAYSQLLGFIPDDVLEVNRLDYELAFNLFYALVRQRIAQVIDGKVSAENQVAAIDVLVDDIVNALLKINKGLKDMWPEFSEENVLALQSHERADFYHRFFKILLQAATVDGMSTREDTEDLIGAMAYGWSLDSPAAIESGKAAYRLVEALRARNLKDFPLLSKIVCSIQLTLRKKDVSAGQNLVEQINQIITSNAAGQYLELIYAAFKGTAWKTIEKAIAKDDFPSLDRLGRLLVFLTSKTDFVAEDVTPE